MRTRSEVRPFEVATPRRLKGRSGVIAAGSRARVAYVELLNNAAPVLESLYLDGGAGSDGYLAFEVTCNGVRLPYDWAYLNTAMPMQDVHQNLPAGALLEVWATNSHPTDDQEAFSDGEVCFYESPLR